jgi:hypothetical protein
MERDMKLGSPVTITLILLGAALLGIVYHFTAAPLEQLSDAPIVDYGDNAMRYIAALFGRRI